MDEKYTNSFIDSLSQYLYKLQYLAASDRITLRALNSFKIFHWLYEWADWFEVSEKDKIKIEKLMNCLILRNSNLVLPTIDPLCIYYSNVSSPQTIYTWQNLCDNPDVVTYSDITPPDPTKNLLTVTSINGEDGVPIAVSVPDEDNYTNGVTPFTRLYSSGLYVDLSAPNLLPSGNVFEKWTLNGVSQAIGQTDISVHMNIPQTAVAVYTIPSDTFTVRVQSGDSSSISITVNKEDINGLSNGTTGFDRTYNNGETVVFTAPPVLSNGNTFYRWSIDGVVQPPALNAITITGTTNPILLIAYYLPYTPDTGTLSIFKIVTNPLGGETSDNTLFNVRISRGNNVFTGQVAQDSPLVIPNIPYGTYTIVEENDPRYATGVLSLSTVTLSPNNTSQTVLIINQQITVPPPTGTLTINKVVKSGGEIISDNTPFKVAVSFNGIVIANVLVSQEQPATLDNLALGTYTIEETPNTLYYTDIDKPSVTFTSENLTETVTITNNLLGPELGTLKIAKSIINEPYSEGPSTFTYNITCADPVINMTVTGGKNEEILIPDLPYGTYTVTEETDEFYATVSISPSNPVISILTPNPEVSVVNTRLYFDGIAHGRLYNWYACTDSREIASEGWRVPTKSDWELLQSTVGANNASVVKDIDYYEPPYSVTPTNELLFNSRGSGKRGSIFTGLLTLGRYHTSTLADLGPPAPHNFQVSIDSYPNTIGLSSADRVTTGASVRLVKNTTTLANGENGIYIGNDGHMYDTVCIGTQEWLAYNLAETKYRNQDVIPEVTDGPTWDALSTGAWCSYDNDPSFIFILP